MNIAIESLGLALVIVFWMFCLWQIKRLTQQLRSLRKEKENAR